jgi:hypothetical protein
LLFVRVAFTSIAEAFGLVEVGSMKVSARIGYNDPMEYDDRDAYTGKLAERGLEIHSFDGRNVAIPNARNDDEEQYEDDV